MSNKWTSKEVAILKENYGVKSDEEIAKMLDRTIDSVSSKRKRLGLLNTNKKYTFKDVQDEMNKRGYELISKNNEYKDCLSKIKFICPNHKNIGIQEISLSHLLQGEQCRYCAIEKRGLKKRLDLNDPELINESKQLCEKLNFEFLYLSRENNKIYIHFICNNHRIFGEQKMVRGNMQRSTTKGCQYCNNRNLPKWYIKSQIEKIAPNITILTEYEKITDRVEYICNIHDTQSKTTVQNILRGIFCKECGIEKQSQHSMIPRSQVEKRLKEELNYSLVGEYEGIAKHSKIKCNKCGYIWDANLSSTLHIKTQCPNCGDSTSKGELKLKSILINNDINFVSQYRDIRCKNIRVLPFDIGILTKDNQILCLIEYDGRQHFQPVEYFGGSNNYLNNFETTKKNDSIKNQFCRDNNIPLIRIPYWEYNNMENYLNRQFKELDIQLEVK